MFAPPPAPPPIELRQGQCFRFALPQGWRIGEDGQFAVSLMSPQQDAVVATVGNSGLPPYVSPGQYLWDQLSRMQLIGLRFGPPRPAAPVLGFAQAWEHDAEYLFAGVPCQGIARCSAAPSYDSVTLVMTWAASHAARWPWYAGWLPQVAAQVEITNGAAFGMRALGQQNLHNSMALGAQAQQQRAWSQALWAGVTQERQASQDRVAFERGQGLEGVQRFDNPYDQRPIDLPSHNAVYWVHPQTGQILGHPDPNFDPRTPGDTSWKPMPRSTPPGT